MIPAVDGRMVIGKAYEEACAIADLADGPDKEKAKKKWAKRHKFSRFPRVLCRGNPDARDHCEGSHDFEEILAHPGRYRVDPLS